MRAVGYVRVSTAAQAADGLSLDAQKQRIQERAEAKGWSLAEVYTDEGVSGRKVERPELDRMLSTLGEIDCIIVWKLDRLGRNTKHMLGLYDRLEAAEVDLVSLSDDIDTSTPMGKAMRVIMSALAELESATTGERVKAVMGGRVEKGKHHGKAPFGYVKKDKKLVPDPAAALIVKRIFNELVAGAGTRAIAQKLNAEKVRRPDGGIWRSSTVSKISANPTYNGRNLHGDQAFKGEHKAIITDAVWGKVQAIRTANRESTAKGRGRRPKRHLFGKGMLRCGKCGASMGPTTGGNGYETYRCLTRLEGGDCDMSNVPRKLVDKAAYDYFERVGIDVEATRTQLEGTAAAKLNEANEQLKLAQVAEREATAAVKRVQDDYTSGEITAAEWKALRPGLESTQQDATQHRTDLEAEIVSVTEARKRIDGVEATAERLAAIRAAVAGDIKGDAELEAVRAALTRAFEAFMIAPSTSRKLTDAELAVMVAQAQEAGYDDAVPDDDRFAELDAGTWTIQPIPRLELVEGLEVEWRPVLKAEGLGNAPLSVVGDAIQFLDGPGDRSHVGPDGEDGPERDSGDGEGADSELVGAGAERDLVF